MSDTFSQEEKWMAMGLYLVDRGYLSQDQLQNFIQAKREMYEDEQEKFAKIEKDEIRRYK